MEEPGQKLKRARERLNLRYRDVAEASRQIAQRHHNDEFALALSRLADIENQGTVPTIYRIYTLCAIYRLDWQEVLEWYGVDLARLAADAAAVRLETTHAIGFRPDPAAEALLPLALDPTVDLRKTAYLSRLIQRWGKLPLALLSGLDLKDHRYAFIGWEDWSMYPLLHPGALVLVDEGRRKIVAGGWSSEFDRPVYLLEHREGYRVGWCSLAGDRMVLQPHPGSPCRPEIFAYPRDIEVIGQIAGVAMLLDSGRRRRPHGTAVAPGPPGP